MIIHVVVPGDTPASVAALYGVAEENLLADNGLTPADRLVSGEALAVQFPEKIYTVRPGDTLFSIAKNLGISLRQLYRNNFRLGGKPNLRPGEQLILSYQNQGSQGSFFTNSYAYPYISPELLRSQLPYLTFFTPFTYGIDREGGLLDLNDRSLLALAKEYGTKSLMHLSTLTEEDRFSNQRASLIFNNPEKQAQLISQILQIIEEKGYYGLDVDFEFIYPEERYDYITFLQSLRLRLNPVGRPLFSALAPKTADDQRGILYEGHDYAGIGAAVNLALLMTYEWGYTYGPPMAVAPLPNVRRVAEYALTRISGKKLLLGIPTYGYDWTLPFRPGNPGAPSLSPVEALALARQHGAEIQYDDTAQAPWFHYTDAGGQLHEVWFEDARSIRAKLALAKELEIAGIGFWNAMRPFPQALTVLNNQYSILENPQIPGL